jgi:hypothetical protein
MNFLDLDPNEMLRRFHPAKWHYAYVVTIIVQGPDSPNRVEADLLLELDPVDSGLDAVKTILYDAFMKAVKKTKNKP